MKRKRTKQGFTLFELIVVIAVIGILAAVLIPTFGYIIETSRKRADESDARNMTTELVSFVQMNNLSFNDIDAPLIRNVVESNYSFIPRVSGYHFFFDKEERAIKVGTFNDGVVAYAAVSGEELEEIRPGFLLLDKGGSDLAEAIYGIRNLENINDFASLALKAKNAGADSAIIDSFSPQNTIYISSIGGITETAVGYLNKTKVIFADNVQTIPSLIFYQGESTVELNLTESIKLPPLVSTIEKGAFSYIDFVNTDVLITASNSNILVETGAFTVSNASAFKQLPQPTSLNIASGLIEVTYKLIIGSSEQAIKLKPYTETSNVINKIVLPTGSVEKKVIVDFKDGGRKASISTHQYSDENGFKVFVVRLYDAGGALIGKTEFKYIEF
ncbi:MAG: type II secretion system protein [Clostridia bacterium]